MHRPDRTPSRRRRRGFLAALLIALLAGTMLATARPALAVTPGNGTLVYSPAAGSSFNPEGGRAAGTTYAKMIVLKNSGSSNGTHLVTFDQLVLENGAQVYPIYRSTDNGGSYSRISTIRPSADFPNLTRTAQPALYETPVQLGTMPAGTILLTGMLMPEDRSSSRLVMYKSLDHGSSWSLVSTIDTGGPATYDPSPTSTTSTVWEPSVSVDANGGLDVYYSDERQKADGVLQAVVYRRSTDGGQTWGNVVNVSAPTNRSDRPGMITVTRMGNGRYIATFEVVNRPSQQNNTAPVYFKTSVDGLNWSPATSIGAPVRLRDGRGIGSSPQVRWVPTGGPNGMVIVSSKWALTPDGAIDGGQNFYVNYDYGEGPWERMPFPVTYDAADQNGGTFSGFAQGFDTSVDGRTIYQSTNVENSSTTYNDVRVGSLPLDAQQYEAERATLTDATIVTHGDAVGGKKVGNINNADSAVRFTVQVPAAGTYTVDVRYDNGSGNSSSHQVSVDNAAATSVSYPATTNWGRFRWVQFTASLDAGSNTITFSKGTGYAELDQIQVYRAATATDPQFRVLNRNSGKALEIASAATADGAPAGQWGDTNNPTQIWTLHPVSNGTQLMNANSGKLLEIPNAATVDGVRAAQWGPTGNNTQVWSLQGSQGWWTLTNRNSGKLLEVADASTSDGAAAQQYTGNGNTTQQWQLVHEAIQ